MSPGDDDDDDDIEITTDTVSKFEHSESSYNTKEAVRGSGSSDDADEPQSDDRQERG